MRKDEIRKDVTEAAFDFFYWFSRLEFALKENGYLRKNDAGSKAEPGWSAFVDSWKDAYSLSEEAIALRRARPEEQIVSVDQTLQWKAIQLNQSRSELDQTVKLLKTVRNNLFHGGKHGGAGWDSPDRTKMMLQNGKAVLDQLAHLASLEADYTQYY